MNNSNIIYEALLNYDYEKIFIDYLKNLNPEIEFENNPGELRNKIIFKDPLTKEIILKSEYEYIAFFHCEYKIWVWGWSVTSFDFKEITYIIELLKHALQLSKEYNYIKSLLTTSRAIINNLIQIDINLAIVGYYIYNSYIYPIEKKVGDKNIIYYIILLNKEAILKRSQENDEKNKQI